MEWFGLIAFILVMSMPNPASRAEVKKLANRIRNLENGQKGEKSVMSKLVTEFIGKKCKITSTGLVEVNFSEPIYTIIDADEDWVKVQKEGKKNGTITKIMKIADIVCIEEVK